MIEAKKRTYMYIFCWRCPWQACLVLGLNLVLWPHCGGILRMKVQSILCWPHLSQKHRLHRGYLNRMRYIDQIIPRYLVLDVGFWYLSKPPNFNCHHKQLSWHFIICSLCITRMSVLYLVDCFLHICHAFKNIITWCYSGITF